MIIVLIVVIIGILSVFRSVKKICKCKSQMNVTSLEAVGSPTVQKDDGTLSNTTDPFFIFWIRLESSIHSPEFKQWKNQYDTLRNFWTGSSPEACEYLLKYQV
jgi:hypothetical protein